MFYPVNFVYLFFNPDLAFNFVFLLDIFLVGVFTFFFSKQLGMKNESAFFSALTFMFSAYFADHIFAGHLANIDAIIWIPVTFLFTEILIKKRRPIYIFPLSIVLSLQFLAGHIQHSFYSNIALGIFFLVRNIQIFLKEKKLKINIKLVSLFALSILIFLLLSSIQLFPSFEFFFSSTRSGGLPFESASLFSLSPYQLVGFVVPEFFGTPLDQSYWGGRNFFELTAYIGIISILLAIIGFLFVKNDYMLVFTIIIIFSLLYAFGKYTPFYRFFFNYIPGFNVFRIPATTLFIYVFSMSILSGFGFSFLFSKLSRKKKKKLLNLVKFLTIILILLIIILIILYFQKQRILDLGKKILLRKYEVHSNGNVLKSVDRYLEKIPLVYKHIIESLLLLTTLLFTSILLLYLRIYRKIPNKTLKILIIILLLIDLWFFWQKYLLIVRPEEIYEKPKIEEIDVLDIISIVKEKDDMFRVYDSSEWTIPQHITIRNGIELVNGYDLSILDRYETFIVEMLGYKGPIDKEYLSRGMSLLNTKYVVTHEKLNNTDDFKLVYYTNRTIKMMPRAFIATSKYETNQTYVYLNEKFLPRAYVVPNARIIKNGEMVLEELKSEEFNPLEEVIIEEDLKTPLSNDGKFQRANLTFYSPNKIVVEVDSKYPGYLILSENWYPGWKAYDNGKEVEIFRANYILRSIYLEKGKHEIKLIYKPTSLKIGSWISFTTLLFLIIVIIYKCKRG